MNPHPADATGSNKSAVATWRTLPAGIWALGFGSLFMDLSSEMIHSLLPVFMVTTLGASMITLGIIEGVAEATAAIVRVFSGSLGDYLGKRKFLMVAGYALAAFTKPVFPLASTVGWVFTARFIDRVGKGIRDALVAELAPPPVRGAAYGLRQALDSVGALAGPLLAVALMVWLANDIRTVLWIAVVPAFIAVLLPVAADLALAFATSPPAVLAGAALWGLHMALTQGLLAKLVADTAPAELLGTGFGVFNLVSGIALLLASVIAGTLWSAFGAAATFLAGAVFAAVAAIGLLVATRDRLTPRTAG